MKKSRKQKPRAKHRAPKPAAPPRRVYAAPRKHASLGTIVRTAERRLSAFGASSLAFIRGEASDVSALAHRISPRDIGTKLRRIGAEARAISLPYSSDEREALALLFLPFLLVASAIVVHQSVRTLQSYITVVGAPDMEIAPVRPNTIGGPSLAALPRTVAREVTSSLTALPPVAVMQSENIRTAPPGLALAARPSEAPVTLIPRPDTDLEPRTALAELSPLAPAAQTPPQETALALLSPAQEAHDDLPIAIPPVVIDAYDADENGNPVLAGICSIEQGSARHVASAPADASGGNQSLTGDAFGLRLAEAAESQVGGFVIYNDAYRRISFPMGDVPSLFGVCTDVIVRAYRALGLDLQALVHQARSGRGDTNIDHRRTEVLRRFFATQGESLPVTSFAEDYRPGDIVTYYRPQNQRSRSHIAMVSSVIAPSGRPMIIHNRGWGPQLEDALFVDQITGHYRYRGPSQIRNAAREKLHDKLPAGRSHGRAGLRAPVVPASYAPPPADAPRLAGH